MMDNLCEFSLIIPGWLGPVFAVVGLVLTVLGYAFLAKGARIKADDKITLKLWVLEFSTGLVGSTVVAGIVFLVLGIAGIAATYHQPSTRWLGSMVTSLVDKKDPVVLGEFNNVTIGTIERNLGETGLYAVQPTTAAKQEGVTGVYKNGRCYAELITQICRQESRRLACNVDRGKKIIRVCKLPDDAECAGK
jgi:hypothetical protein